MATGVRIEKPGLVDIIVQPDGMVEKLVDVRQEGVIRIVKGDKDRVVEVDK